MKPQALSLAMACALLSLASATRAESVMERAQFFVSQRVWQADWDVGATTTQIIAPSATQAAPLLRTDTHFMKVRETIPLTGFGVSIDRWTLSATVGWSSDFKDPRFDGKASRSEYDVNLGYAVTPNVSVVVVHKAGEADIPPEAGNPAAAAFRERQKLRGTGLGVSMRHPFAENWNLYGSAAYGAGRGRFRNSPERLSVRYTVAEAGVGYRIPGAFANMSLTAGYRYQSFDFRNGMNYTYALTPEPVLVSSTPRRIQPATKGFTMGVAFSF